MICLDSDCIIDFLKGRREAEDIVERYKEEIVTTEINVFEVFVGIYNKKIINKKEENTASNFFNSLDVLSFNRKCGKIGAKILSDLIKKGTMIEQNDVLIASILLKNGINQIITGNKKHFIRMKGIDVITY